VRDVPFHVDEIYMPESILAIGIRIFVAMAEQSVAIIELARFIYCNTPILPVLSITQGALAKNAH
jgi:hypothetical protein